MKKFIMKSLSMLFISALTLTGLTGCGEQGSVKEVNIAYFPNITHTQALVTKSQGTLEKKWEGKYNVNWVSFNAGPAEVEAIFAGAVDIGYIGPVPAINAYSKSKGDVKIMANATNAGAVLVKRKGSDIESIKDLDGKTIAIPQLGNTQHLCLLDLMAKNGLKSVDQGGTVKVQAVSNADVQNLFDNGSLDAALVPEPWGSILEKKSGAELVMDHKEVFMNGDYPVAVVIANQKFAEKNPEIINDFLQAHKDATLYINDNKSEAARLVNKEIEKVTGKVIDESVLDSAFERIIVDEQPSLDSIMSFAKINLEQDFIKEMPGEDILNDTIIKSMK